ncbi:keratinocyte proline-rich protein-like [Physella acuta]|uniref:keratinocyte proline-rich protein-like n=1 Tax=Physella acuta TaxID=109671 RepID=UPI0027DC06D9|nr:keratinocyte proline-rich protein-like [Physella acuta]
MAALSLNYHISTSSRSKCILITFILLVFAFGGVDGRRSGGRSSRSRIGRSSGTFSRNNRVMSRIPLSGRIVGGSSPYTSSTWMVAASAGMIYGSMRYRKLYPHSNKMPTICTNNKEKSPSGTVYGYFICPRENESLNAVYCCGPDKREYCCNESEAEAYFMLHERNKATNMSVGTIVGIIVAVVVIVAVGALCCKKRKQAGKIIRKFSKRGSSQRYCGPQTVPLNSADPGYALAHEEKPAQPPPSYADVVSHGEPYPPLAKTSEALGTGYPPPMGHGAPASYQDMPFPPPSDVPYPYSNVPYPPCSGAPYPQPTGAPYPQPSGAPYPQPTGAPYPQPSGAPYPQPSGAPYPQPSGAPYPQPTGAPYPQPGEFPYPQHSETSYPEPRGAPYPQPSGGSYSPTHETHQPASGAPYPDEIHTYSGVTPQTADISESTLPTAPQYEPVALNSPVQESSNSYGARL